MVTKILYTEASKTSKMELCAKIVNGFSHKAPSYMFDWVLIKLPLSFQYEILNLLFKKTTKT